MLDELLKETINRMQETGNQSLSSLEMLSVSLIAPICMVILAILSIRSDPNSKYKRLNRHYKIRK